MAEAVSRCLRSCMTTPIFRRFPTASAATRTTRLIGAILKLFTYTRSHPFPEKWLRDMTNMLDASVPAGETAWGKRPCATRARCSIMRCGSSRDEYELASGVRSF